MAPLVKSTGIVSSSTGTPQMWAITTDTTAGTPGTQRSARGSTGTGPGGG